MMITHLFSYVILYEVFFYLPLFSFPFYVLLLNWFINIYVYYIY